MAKRNQKRSNLKITKTRAQSTSQGEPQPSTSNGISRSNARDSSTSSGSDTSESDDNYAPSSSLKTSRGRNNAEQSQDQISPAEESRLVSDCVFYLFVADQKKNAIKKPDIIKHVFKEHKKQFKNIIQLTELYLKKTFGIRLVELETPKGHYILVNEVKGCSGFIEISKAEKRKVGFTMTVLAIIFMQEDFVSESDMWKALKVIGIDPDVKHPVFGDVKKLLTQELVKNLYLEYKRENSDPPVFAFSWGPRAKFEVSKRDVLQFVCDIYGDNMTPEQWPSQYNEVVKSEEAGEGPVGRTGS